MKFFTLSAIQGRGASLFVLLLCLVCSNSHGARNKALVVGISQYIEINSLRYADADALEFSQLLTDFAGYGKSDVKILLNQAATKKNIVDEINRIVRESEIQPFDNFIFMFAGHGMESTLAGRSGKQAIESRETNIFLAPADASTDDNNFYSTGKGKEISNETFINKAWLARQLSAIKAKSIFVILDSCYSGTRSFGALFLENEGYAIQGFGTSASDRGVAAVKKRNLSATMPGGDLEVRSKRVAYLASSRDDQTSAEYEELRHGALSYCIFEYVKRLRRSVLIGDRREITIDDVYVNIVDLFRQTKVMGASLDIAHQPMLIPIPDYGSMQDLVFLSVSGAMEREIARGGLYIRTEPSGLEIFVDGEKRPEVSDARLVLPVGRHSIELYLPGTGYRHSFTADISAAQTVEEKFSMNGELEIASFWKSGNAKSPGPPLDIYIDGTKVGKSQLLRKTLLAGTHLIEVRYLDVVKSRHVEIRPDSPLRINYSVILVATPAVDRTGVGSVAF